MAAASAVGAAEAAGDSAAAEVETAEIGLEEQAELLLLLLLLLSRQTMAYGLTVKEHYNKPSGAMVSVKRSGGVAQNVDREKTTGIDHN